MRISRFITLIALLLSSAVLTAADSNLIFRVYPTDLAGNFTTNLVLGVPYRLVVELDTTQNPTVKILAASWDIACPTSWLDFTSSAFPPASDDFFYGGTENPPFNSVDSVRDVNGWLNDNSRISNIGSDVSNRVGALGYYYVTPVKIKTNVYTPLNNVFIYDTANALYSVANGNLTTTPMTFNIVPEPSTLVLVFGGFASLLLLRRYRR